MNYRILPLLLVCYAHAFCAEVYPNLNDPLEKLVYGRPVEHYDEKAMREWEAAIAKFPNAKDRMLLLFERDYTQAKNWELLAFPMAALAKRPDLKSEDLDRIEKEMRVVAGQKNRSQLGSSLLSSGVPLLVIHPTPERESLVVRLARDDDWSVALAALQGLVAMGSKKAKSEIENALRRRRIPGKDQSLDWILSEVTTLLHSYEVKPRPSVNSPSAVLQPAPKKALTTLTTSTPSEEPTSSTPWSIIVVLIFAACGLLWLVVKKRK